MTRTTTLLGIAAAALLALAPGEALAQKPIGPPGTGADGPYSTGIAASPTTGGVVCQVVAEAESELLLVDFPHIHGRGKVSCTQPISSISHTVDYMGVDPRTGAAFSERRTSAGASNVVADSFDSLRRAPMIRTYVRYCATLTIPNVMFQKPICADTRTPVATVDYLVRTG